MSEIEKGRVWIIQRCINAFTNHYEDWPGYCETPMTRDEMTQALKKAMKSGLNMNFEGTT